MIRRTAAAALFYCSIFSLQAQTISSREACNRLHPLKIPASAIGLPTRGAYITSAKIRHTGSAEYCRALGKIVSVDPTAQPIRFELNLPTQWNGKAVHFGGGSFDGALSLANGRGVPSDGIRSEPTPLQRGFATFGSDSGHHRNYFPLPDALNALRANFALNLEERRNFDHDALKKVHDTAVALIEKRFGAPPRRMFFLGGSTGGREAYFVTQLWPNDYDGVLGAYAAWNQVELDLQFIRVSQAEYRRGDKLTRGWLPPSATRLVATKVMDACDAADGLHDGIISNPEACHFDLQNLACAPGRYHKSCLTPGQLQTFDIFASEQRTALPLARGIQSIPGFNITSGTDLTGSMGLFRHPFHNPIFLLNSFYYLVADGVLRYFLSRDPHFDALSFDPAVSGAYAAGVLQQSESSDASNADLTRFAQHGAKFLILHGTTDATIPTGASVQFYNRMIAAMGQPAVDQFARFFLVPGFGHGRGVFNAGFDALGVLDRWLDSGTPPGNLTAVDNNRSEAHRSRPLCVYPTWPKYVSGDPDQASSFTCVTP
jgi:acetyl esterase/lipase